MDIKAIVSIRTDNIDGTSLDFDVVAGIDQSGGLVTVSRAYAAGDRILAIDFATQVGTAYTVMGPGIPLNDMPVAPGDTFQLTMSSLNVPFQAGGTAVVADDGTIASTIGNALNVAMMVIASGIVTGPDDPGDDEPGDDEPPPPAPPVADRPQHIVLRWGVGIVDCGGVDPILDGTSTIDGVGPNRAEVDFPADSIWLVTGAATPELNGWHQTHEPTEDGPVPATRPTPDTVIGSYGETIADISTGYPVLVLSNMAVPYDALWSVRRIDVQDHAWAVIHTGSNGGIITVDDAALAAGYRVPYYAHLIRLAVTDPAGGTLQLDESQGVPLTVMHLGGGGPVTIQGTNGPATTVDSGETVQVVSRNGFGAYTTLLGS